MSVKTISLSAVMRVAEYAVVKRLDAEAPDYEVVFSQDGERATIRRVGSPLKVAAVISTVE